MDSLEKIIETMEAPVTLHRCPTCGGSHAANEKWDWAGVVQRLRALRERDEKRMERDQAFIEAALEFCEGYDGLTFVAGAMDELLAAYRARREERGKHGVTEEVK